MRYLLYLLEILIIVTLLHCGQSTESSGDNWRSLGFEDKLASRLVLSEPFLYVCAGSNGLWRKNIRQDSEFEYLGLADTSLGEISTRGVQDVLIHPENQNWLLVSFNSGKGEDHVIFRSYNSGNSWTTADSGLDVYIEKSYSRVFRLLYYEDYILGAGEGVFKTSDFADYWEKIPISSSASGNVLAQHAFELNNLWLGGQDPLFGPTLAHSTDGGSTWQRPNLWEHGVPYLGSVSSIAIDPFDVNTVYVGVAGMMIKTTDNGQTWKVPLIKGTFEAIEPDSRKRNHFWACTPSGTMIETFEGGNIWREIQLPIEYRVFDMLWDDMSRKMFIATGGGIYYFRL